jgi:hypothetical protein
MDGDTRTRGGGWRNHLPLRGRWLEIFAAVATPPLVLVGILCAVVALLFGLNIPGHNLRLARLEQCVSRNLAHPTDSRLIVRRQVVGNLNGTGNGCTFAVVELRKGGGSPELLRQFYASQWVTDPDSGQALEVVLRTAPVAPAELFAGADALMRLTSADERKAADYALVVSCWSESGSDYRCE